MRHSETRELFEQTFEFPADHDTVVEQLGDVELTSPVGDVVTIRSILERTNETSYRSADGLYTTLLGGLEDGFIGRKYYDDRGGVATDSDTFAPETESF
ncbi:MAG: hypothetical protein ABEJ47_01855 [Halorhabdus sp.]